MNKQAEQQWINQASCRKAERAALIIDKARVAELANAPGLHPRLKAAYDNMLRDINAKLKIL